MRRNSQYVISGLGALAALGFFVVGLEMSAATASSGLHRAVQTQSVDRGAKGDRLPIISEKARSRNAVNGPVETPRAPVRQELLDGCESIVSAIAQSPLSQVPGRCVS